ncbi:MAG TPA: hypothetical protein PLC79_10150, partial [Phycisphaerae bacterium]|nr:hypothetical protein [Phycisphaerae bacterium]
VRQWLAPLVYSQMETAGAFAAGHGGSNGGGMGGGGRTEQEKQADTESKDGRMEAAGTVPGPKK